MAPVVNASAVQRVWLWDSAMVHTPLCTIHTLTDMHPILGSLIPHDPPCTDAHICPPSWWPGVAVAHTLHQQHQQLTDFIRSISSVDGHAFNPAGHPCPAPQPCRTLSAWPAVNNAGNTLTAHLAKHQICRESDHTTPCGAGHTLAKTPMYCKRSTLKLACTGPYVEMANAPARGIHNSHM